MKPILADSPTVSEVPMDSGSWAFNADTTTTLSDNLMSMATDLKNSNKGAYYILDVGDDNHMPKVAVFASMESSASYPTYGGVMIQ